MMDESMRKVHKKQKVFFKSSLSPFTLLKDTRAEEFLLFAEIISHGRCVLHHHVMSESRVKKGEYRHLKYFGV